jgi:hypothetical protein
VKDEGTNLFTMTYVLKQIVNCEKLGILAPFKCVCFRHALLKTCQYAIFDEKVILGLQPISNKFPQSSIQACITLPKKSRKQRAKWT